MTDWRAAKFEMQQYMAALLSLETKLNFLSYLYLTASHFSYKKSFLSKCYLIGGFVLQ